MQTTRTSSARNGHSAPAPRIGEMLEWGVVVGIRSPDPASKNRSRIVQIRCASCRQIACLRVWDARNRVKSCGCAKKAAFLAKINLDLARVSPLDRKEYLVQRYRYRRSREECAKFLKISPYAIDFLDREERRKVLSSFSKRVQMKIRAAVIRDNQPVAVVAEEYKITFAECWIIATTAGWVTRGQLTTMVDQAKEAVYVASQIVTYYKYGNGRSRDLGRQPGVHAGPKEIEKYRKAIARASRAGHRILYKDGLGYLTQKELHIDRKGRASGKFGKLHKFVEEYADCVPWTVKFWFDGFSSIVKKTVAHRKANADWYRQQCWTRHSNMQKIAAREWSFALPIAA